MLISIVLIVVVLEHFAEAQRVVAVLQRASWGWVLVALVLQGSTYAAVAALFFNLTAVLGHPVPLRRLYRLAVAMVFLNNAFPAAGASGAAFLTKTLRRDGIGTSKSLLLSALYYLFNWFTFFSFLAVGFLLLFAAHRTSGVQILLGAVSLLTAATFVVAVVLLARHRVRFVAVVRFVAHLLSRVLRWFRRRGPDPVSAAASAGLFHDGFTATLAHPGTFSRTLMASGLEHLLDLLTIAAVFAAFAQPINLGVLIVGYFLASLLAFLSFIPTGLGIFEGSLVGLYTALGVPFEAAAVTVLVYRALSFWLPIPFGFALYEQLLRQGRTPLQPASRTVG